MIIEIRDVNGADILENLVEIDCRNYRCKWLNGGDIDWYICIWFFFPYTSMAIDICFDTKFIVHIWPNRIQIRNRLGKWILLMMTIVLKISDTNSW